MREVLCFYFGPLNVFCGLDKLISYRAGETTQDVAGTDQARSDFDKVIILGNSCDRSIITRAVRQKPW